MNFVTYINYTDVYDDSDYLSYCIRTSKVLVIKNHRSITSVIDDTTRSVSKFGRMVNIDEDLKSGKTTDQLFMEISFDPEQQFQYRTAKSHQPLHTDFSYLPVNNTIQFLMCMKQAPIGGATTFIDTRRLVELMNMDGETKMYEDLLTIPVSHSKGDLIKTQPILEVIEDDYKINWNYQPAIRAKNTDQAKTLIQYFKDWLDNRIEKSGLLTPVLLETNDTVFFHDYRVLHGRNSYFANVKGDRRLVKGTLVFNQ